MSPASGIAGHCGFGGAPAGTTQASATSAEANASSIADAITPDPANDESFDTPTS
jgi:hypothetical protein